MSKKHKGNGSPIPKGNRSHFGPNAGLEEEKPQTVEEANIVEEDPNRPPTQHGVAGEAPPEPDQSQRQAK